MSNFKILGNGEISTKVKIKALEASKSAGEKIRQAGGEIKIIKKKNNISIDTESKVSDE